MTAKQMSEKVDLVTGGASGIGRASAMAMAGQGAIVVVADIDEGGGNEVAEAIRDGGTRGLFIRADATNEKEVAGLVERIVQEFGGLHWALNNVGRGELRKTVVTTTEESWDRILTVSLKSTWLAMKYEIPVMAASGGGAIVNMASIAGMVPVITSSPAYAAAKAGVIQLTRYAARAHAKDGIRINSVAPGLTITPTVSRWFTVEDISETTTNSQFIHRATESDEVAAVVAFLLSPQAAMITGTNIPIAGGTA